MEVHDLVQQPGNSRKKFRYCSAYGCLTKSPNSSDIHMHRVKKEWFQETVPWKTSKPTNVCDLHFLPDDFKTSYVEGRKCNHLKPDSKPLTGDELVKKRESLKTDTEFGIPAVGSEDIVAVLNTLLNAKPEAEQIITELHSHTHLPWCKQQINKMNNLYLSLDHAIRSLQRCVGTKVTTIFLPVTSNDDIKQEHSGDHTKDMVTATEDNSTFNNSSDLVKTETIESEEVKTEFITNVKEEISNDDSELNDEDNFGLDHFLSVNILEKDAMREFEADDKVEDNILDDFHQEENKNIEENILARNKRKAENQGNSPRKKITGSYEKQSEKSSSILSSLPSNQSETTF